MQKHNPFFELLKPHYHDAANFCRGLNYRNHEDILQEALLKAMRGFGGLRDPQKFRSWLFQIISREATTFHRRYFWRRFTEWTDGQPDDRHVSAPAPIEGLAELEQVLAELPRKKRETLLLHDLGGFSIKEIAAMNGESESAVKSRLSPTRRELAIQITAGLPLYNQPQTVTELYDEVESFVLLNRE